MAVLIQNRGSQKPYIKILLRNQESFVVDGGTNTKYFRLGRGARQGHTTSAFRDIISSSGFDHCYLFSVYADDAIFFLQDTISIKHMIDTFYFFRTFLD